MNVLDVGCGTGTLAVKAARKGARVVGMDISQDMISIVREKAEERGVSDAVEFIRLGVLEMDEHFKE